MNLSVGLSCFHILYGRMPLFLADIPFHAIERESEEANIFMRERAKLFKQVQEKLQNNNLKYKEREIIKRRQSVFEEEDLLLVYVHKDRNPMGEYNKLKARKIGPCKILW